ncbi:MAG: MbnP family copper-binding protein [Pseudomonadota bacterium]
MRTAKLVTLASLFALSSGLAAAEETFTINVVGEFGGKPFSCSQTYGSVGTTGSTVEVMDYRLFISNVALVAADGTRTPLTLEQDGAWQYGPVALIDFEDGTGSCANGTSQMNGTIVGTAPAGEYEGLALTVGVPFDLNHGDPTLAASPLNLTAMFWNWRGGYKFVKLDLATAGQPMTVAASNADHGGESNAHGSARGWSLHLGSTMCASASRTTAPSACENPNRMDVVFDAFDPSTNSIVIDPQPVLAMANVDENTPETSPGCMSFPDDPECATVMPRLGFAYGDAPAEPQQLVTMR